MLERRWVGEVLFASDIDSPARERVTNGECEPKTRGCSAVRCARSIKGGFIRWFLDNLGCRPPKFCENKKTERRCAMEIECMFYFKLRRKPKTKKVTVVVDEQ